MLHKLDAHSDIQLSHVQVLNIDLLTIKFLLGYEHVTTNYNTKLRR